MKKFVVLVGIVILALLFAACGSDNLQPTIVTPTENQNLDADIGVEIEADSNGDDSLSTQDENLGVEQSEREFAVGDTIRVGNLEITVLGYRFSEGDSFFPPSDGNVYYLIELVIENVGDSVENISSLLMFDLRDEDGFSLDFSMGAQMAGHGGIDGVIPPGRLLRGELGYEIPTDSRGYVLQVNPQVFGVSGLFAVIMDETSSSPASIDNFSITKTGNEVQIGESFIAGDLEFIVNDISMHSGSEFFGPDEGNTFLLIDVSITNNGSDATTVSSMLMFSVRDSYGFSHALSLSALAEGRGSLDGDIMAGGTLRGELGFEVPIDITGLELFVNPDIFDSSKAFIVTLN